MEQRNMDDVWAAKDKRISKQNAINNSTNFVTACIQAGVFKPKDLEKGFDAIKEYMDKIFTLTYETGSGTPCGEERSSIASPKTKDKAEKQDWSFFCTECKKGISEKVKDYSENNFGLALCFDCQKKAREETGKKIGEDQK
jgi:hypothetical protein